MSLASAMMMETELEAFQPSDNFEPLWTEKRLRVFLRGPNRIGKTRHLCALASKRAVDRPGSRVRFVAPTRHFVQTVAGRYLAEFLAGPGGTRGGHLHERSYYVPEKGWNGGTAKTIILTNGSSIQLLSYQDPASAHEGDELDLAILDEPPPFAHLMATQTRLMDRPGAQLFIGATMVNRPDPALREMIEGGDESPKEGRTVHSTGWVQYVGRLSVETCPWKTPQQIAEQLEILRASPWDYAQRADGAWEGVTAGRRFIGFTDENVTRKGPQPGMQVKSALGIDHGEVAGHQHALCAIWKGNQLWILDEYTNLTATTPEEDAAGIAAMLKRNGIPLKSVDYAVGDTNTAGKSSYGGWRINEALEAAFADRVGRRSPPWRIVYPDKSAGSVDWGQRCINYACSRGDLRIHPRCTALITTLRNWKGKSTGDSDDARLAHAADALRYLCVGTLGATPTYSKLRFF